MKYKAFDRATGKEITDIAIAPNGMLTPFASNDTGFYKNRDIAICLDTPFADSKRETIYQDDILVHDQTGFEGIVRTVKGTLVVDFIDADVVLPLDDIHNTCKRVGNINNSIGNPQPDEKLTLEGGYAFIGAGFKEAVYVIRDKKVCKEIIFSGLSLKDAVDLKKDGLLFNNREDAENALALRSNHNRLYADQQLEIQQPLKP